jgi:hypothetical protein
MIQSKQLAELFKTPVCLTWSGDREHKRRKKKQKEEGKWHKRKTTKIEELNDVRTYIHRSSYLA